MNPFRKRFGGHAAGSEPPTSTEQRLTGFLGVNQVFISRALADETQKNLRAAGRTGNEGMVIWSGQQEGQTFEVRTVTVPRQRGIRSAEGVCVVVDGEALHEVNVATYMRGERLFAQIHTHPGRAYHSEMDDRYAIVTAPGGLSLVVPDFAVREFEVDDCAVYRLSSAARWEEVRSRDAAKLIRVGGV